MLSLVTTGVLGLRNTALVFVKPHAATDACENFVREHLTAAGVSIVDSGVKTAAEIKSAKLIDQHYGSLARIAMELQPADVELSETALKAFEEAYGVDWTTALGSALRNDEAMAKLGVDGQALEPMWRGGVQCKLAPGTYVSRLAIPPHPRAARKMVGESMYTLNGFYPAMRQAYIEDGAEVRYLVCEWDEAELSWKGFRREVIGATNPADAAPGSARAELLSKWSALGLPAAPSYGNNGVHASAGPLEGLKERCVWAGGSLDTDALAAALLDGANVPRATLDSWLDDNPVVTLGGQTDKIFDLTEEMGTEAVVALCTQAKESKPPTAAAAGGGDHAAAPTCGAADDAFAMAAPPSGFEWGVTV